MRWPLFIGCVMATLLAFCGPSGAGQPERVFPGVSWATKSPAEAGLDAGKLQEFARRMGVDDPNFHSSGCIVRHGYLVYSWGNQADNSNWASATKPVLSTLLFFAIKEGKLKSVDDKVGDWGWKLSDKDKPMTFRHLANMTSGYACQEPPGAAWNYNDPAIQLYFLTLEKVFGKDINSAATEYFRPLQLQDGVIFSSTGRLITTSRDFARIGWFWLNRGDWAGKQLLPRKFFDDYMKPQVPGNLPLSVTKKADDYLGIGSYGGKPRPTAYGPGKYGFNWWFNVPEGGSAKPFLPDVPADIIMAIGHGGNFKVLMHSLDLVIAGRGDWGHIMPGTERVKFNANLKLLVDAAK